MNAHNMINAMNDTRRSLNERISAASQLWELQNRMNKNLKSFKDELSDLSRMEGEDLTIFSEDGRYMASIERQPPTPKIETLDLDALRRDLGDDLFDKYIAHSYTIRWSEFRLAPDDLRERVLNTPGLEVTQTYQVKFKRASRS